MKKWQEQQIFLPVLHLPFFCFSISFSHGIFATLLYHFAGKSWKWKKNSKLISHAWLGENVGDLFSSVLIKFRRQTQKGMPLEAKKTMEKESLGHDRENILRKSVKLFGKGKRWKLDKPEFITENGLFV